MNVNTTTQLVISVLETIAAAAVNPALGLGASATKIAGIIGLVASLAKEGTVANKALADLDAQIKALEASGGPVPDAVWNEWDRRHAAAKARLQA